MFQFMDESFIIRLSKESGYKYNITVRIVYNDNLINNPFVISIEISLEHLSSFKTNFFIVETS